MPLEGFHLWAVTQLNVVLHSDVPGGEVAALHDLTATLHKQITHSLPSQGWQPGTSTDTHGAAGLCRGIHYSQVSSTPPADFQHPSVWLQLDDPPETLASI